MNERREISFLLTEEDHIAFNRCLHGRLPFWQRHLSLLWLGAALLLSIVLIFNVVFDFGVDRPLFYSALAGIIFWLAIIGGVAWQTHPSQFPRRIRAVLARPQNRHMVGEKTLSLGAEGITATGQAEHSQICLYGKSVNRKGGEGERKRLPRTLRV